MRAREYYRVQVMNGAEYLDCHVPKEINWRERLWSNRQDLSIADCRYCVLGIIFGDYAKGMDEIKLQWTQLQAIAYGFAVGNYPGDVVQNCRTLERLWIREASKYKQYQ